MTRGLAGRPLRTNLSSLYCPIISDLVFHLSLTAIKHSRPPQLSGSSIVIRFVLYFYLCIQTILKPLLEPIHAFSNIHFQKMINLTSHASRDVMIPAPKKTRARIIYMFQQQMYMLRKRLNVCPMPLDGLCLTNITLGSNCCRRYQLDM